MYEREGGGAWGGLFTVMYIWNSRTVDIILFIVSVLQ